VTSIPSAFAVFRLITSSNFLAALRACLPACCLAKFYGQKVHCVETKQGRPRRMTSSRPHRRRTATGRDRENEKKTDAPHAIYRRGPHRHGPSRSDPTTEQQRDDIAASQLNELHSIFAPFQLIEPHSVSRSLSRICTISNWYGSVSGVHRGPSRAEHRRGGPATSCAI
jgi:hypothetical protein